MPKTSKKKLDAADVFRKRVRETMDQQGLNITLLADRLGVNRAEVSRLLSSSIQPRLNTVQSYARALGVRVVDLLKGC